MDTEQSTSPISESPRLPVSASLLSGPKPGYRTTEFWVHAAITLGGLFIASGLVSDDSPIAAAVTTFIAFLSAAIYGKDRVKLKSTLPLLLCGALALPLLTGCSTAYKSDKITSIKTRTFGLQIEQSTTTATPALRLGLITTVIQLIPTSTNGPIQTPKFFDTFEIQNTGNPFTFGVIENTGSGDVMIGTNATGKAIIPTPNAPNKPISPIPGQRMFTPTERR